MFVGRDLIRNIVDFIKPVFASNQIAIIADDIVVNLYLKTLEQNIRSAGFRVCSFSFPHGEKSKNIQMLSGIFGRK